MSLHGNVMLSILTERIVMYQIIIHLEDMFNSYVVIDFDGVWIFICMFYHACIVWPWDNKGKQTILYFVQATLFEALASSNTKIRNVLNDAKDPNKYQQNLLKIAVYFEEFNFESITESPAYKVGTFYTCVTKWLRPDIITSINPATRQKPQEG